MRIRDLYAGGLQGPIYSCTTQKDGVAKEILIDVTRSASSFQSPSKELKQVLEGVLRDRELGIENVVEFGAEKLKNATLILQNGKSLCAVEFERLRANPITRKNMEENKRNKRFIVLTPERFIYDNKKFDLALLINVVPTMPVPEERLSVLKLLNERLNGGKFLLWFAQKEGHYRKIKEKGENTCEDGIWMGASRPLKTFYRYYPVNEITEMMRSAGFSKVKQFASKANDILLYRRE